MPCHDVGRAFKLLLLSPTTHIMMDERFMRVLVDWLEHEAAIRVIDHGDKSTKFLHSSLVDEDSTCFMKALYCCSKSIRNNMGIPGSHLSL